MKFTFETEYNQKALSVMAKCIRKTARAKHSKRSHIFGWIVIALALLLSFSSGDEGVVITFKTVITWVAVAVMLIVLLFEDKINGYFARKRMLKGTEKAVATFDTEIPDMFVSQTEVGKSEFNYDKIAMIAETDLYFVFVFSTSHAQVYDKNSLSSGTTSEFRSFITQKTGKAICPIHMA